MPHLLTSSSRLSSVKIHDSRGNKVMKRITGPGGEVQLGKGKKHQVQGFCVHRGRARGSGHYISYIKEGRQWFCLNDAIKTAVTDKAAHWAMEEAYTLVFVRN